MWSPRQGTFCGGKVAVCRLEFSTPLAYQEEIGVNALHGNHCCCQPVISYRLVQHDHWPEPSPQGVLLLPSTFKEGILLSICIASRTIRFGGAEIMHLSIAWACGRLPNVSVGVVVQPSSQRVTFPKSGCGAKASEMALFLTVSVCAWQRSQPISAQCRALGNQNNDSRGGTLVA